MFFALHRSTHIVYFIRFEKRNVMKKSPLLSLAFFVCMFIGLIPSQSFAISLFGLTEISPGIYSYVGSKQVNLRQRTVSLRVIIINRTGSLSDNAKLLITSTNSEIINAQGITDDGLPYFAINSNSWLDYYSVIHVDFAWPSSNPKITFGFDPGVASNGLVSITGEVTVGEILSARVSDPDNVSSVIEYQWLANNTEINGANASTYELLERDEGQVISVTASYTDDDGFDEVINSAATTPVAPRPINNEGVLSISGVKLVGETLTATIVDANGVSGNVDYQWFSNGQSIDGETSNTLDVTSGVLGQTINVSANYLDNDSFSEELTTQSNALVVTTIVNNQAELAEAVSSSSAGEWIGLAGSDYDNIPELVLGEVTLTLAENSDAMISGATCIHMPTNRAALVGLVFNNIDTIVDSVCDSNGNSSIYIDADNVEIRENKFLGEVAAPSSSTFNWISVKDSYALIERNLFQNKSTNLRGAAISMFNNTSQGDQFGHVVQYNLFKDFLGGEESNATVIQIGRSTNASANGQGTHVIRYNRFENVQTRQRIIRVQSTANAIYNNTFEGTLGNISLENGSRNTVSNNIILSTGEDDASDDGGISFTPYGHVIHNNYIAGLRTTSSQRGGLLTSSERFDDVGNVALTISPVTVSANTIINSRQAINLSARDCVVGSFIIHFENNLIANGEDPTLDLETNSGTDYGFEGRTANGEGRDAVIDDCALSLESTQNNEHYYSADLSKNGTFAFNSTGSGNIGTDDNEGLADIRSANDGLFEGVGVDTGIGANTSKLVYLTNTDVGPASDFVAPAVQTTFEGPISFDLSTWNITFPDGTQEDNPQWLLDGNTLDDAFYYTDEGAMVFKTDNITAGTTTNSTFPRSELREMLRGPEPDPRPSGFPSTQGLTRNNWVFSSSSQAVQSVVGGVDGVMDACLRVDAVSTDGDNSEVGRVIVGQIHAADDEPAKLYYRKLPGNELGSIYFNHEVPAVGDTTYNLIGSSSTNAANPIDGVALGEIWCYQIKTEGQLLTVSVTREGKPGISRTITMEDDYIDDWMYFRAGMYNQNKSGPQSFGQSTFFSLTKSHNEPPEGPIGGGDSGGEDGSDGGADGGATGDVAALQLAIDNAVAGDVIELNESYSNATLNVDVDGVTLTAAPGSPVVFSGETCLFIRGNDVRISGLEFRNFAQVDGSSCQSNGNASIVINGDRVTFDNNTLDTDTFNPVAEGQNTHNWLAVRNSDAVIERNTFQNKRGLTFDSSAQLRGGFISVFITGSGTGNTIQYNLFKNMLLSDESSAYGIQLGRSSGEDSNEDGLNVVRFNRFDNVNSRTRLIRVQGSNNQIHDNTVVDSQGMIALEDGQNNSVRNNVILPSGNDGNDGGISIAPYGHTVENNYIAGARTSSSERASLYFNWGATGSGNTALAPSPVIVANNTILNARQAVLFGSRTCGSVPFVADLDNNLIANGVSGVSEFEGSTQSGNPAIRDDCAIDASSTIDNTQIYSETLSATATFDLDTFGAGNLLGADAEANLSSDDNGLIRGTSINEGTGADTSLLMVIDELDVGVGSTSAF